MPCHGTAHPIEPQRRESADLRNGGSRRNVLEK
jgi:hypothetical protein